MTLNWERDGRDWPNRAASCFVRAAGLRWHVQRMGAGPTLLLLHGTGSSTHSWRALMPLLAARFDVVAPDLPGHGFTDRPPGHRLSLPAMSRAMSELLQGMQVRPALAAGHSAGAAVLIRMALDERIAPRALVALNGALLPLAGAPGQVFSTIAKALVAIPLVPSVFAWRAADPTMVNRLLQDTGSKLDPEGVALYRRLVRDPGHVAGALGMMANWDLRPLERDMKRLRVPLILVAGGNDKTIQPADAERVRALVPGARVVLLPGLGHLAHEERPREIADLLFGLAPDVAS